MEEKRFAAEEKLSVAVPQRVEVMRHEGITRQESCVGMRPWSLPSLGCKRVPCGLFSSCVQVGRHLPAVVFRNYLLHLPRSWVILKK